MLRIQGLSKQYKTGDKALKGVDLEVPNGQVMALIGPSGAGKSTLIRCVNRLVEPTEGKIYLGDSELTGLSRGPLRRARRKMGMIFQEYALVERLTVMENVLSGRLGYVGFWRSWFRRFPQADVIEAYRLLDRVGLMHMADKRADELSGGQRQRLASVEPLSRIQSCCWSTNRPPASIPRPRGRSCASSMSCALRESSRPSSIFMTCCWRKCSRSASSDSNWAPSFTTAHSQPIDPRGADAHLR